MRRRASVVVASVCLAVVCAVAGAGSAAAASGSSSAPPTASAATQLVRTYSPIVAIDPQTRPCGPGEGYRPTIVGIVLGRRSVVLRNAGGQVVTRGPTARDLSAAPKTDYLDLPGDPLRPGCHYEKQFRQWYGKRSPSVYAHIALDSEPPGRLAVEYWFYWTFNHFTNLHESDWEMMQVDFDASTPQQALAAGPYEVDLAQHAGGERGDWDDDPKLTKVGTHPVTFVSTGSHSEYFQRRLYLGKGGSAIFGCEDTRRNAIRIRPAPVLLPDTPVAISSPYAWLNFDGRWGEKQPSINNGPTGPAAHKQWEHPIAWADGLRRVSVSVPSGRVLGLSTTSFFCDSVDGVSSGLVWAQLHPSLFYGLAGLIVALLALLVVRTSWGAEHGRTPLRAARSCGAMLRGGLRVYRRQPLTFIGIGLVFVPVSLLAAVAQWLLFRVPFLSSLLSLDGHGGDAVVFLALLPGGLGGVISAAVVTAAVSAALSQIEAGHPIGALEASRLAWQRARPLAGATSLQVLVTAILSLTVIGIPVAIWWFVRTSLFAQAVVLESDGSRMARCTSARLTRGRWWRTFLFTALVDLIAVMSGPVAGVLVLLLTSRSLTFINITGSIVYVLTVPFAAIALTLYYFDLQARPAAPLQPLRRRMRAWPRRVRPRAGRTPARARTAGDRGVGLAGHDGSI